MKSTIRSIAMHRAEQEVHLPPNFRQQDVLSHEQLVAAAKAGSAAAFEKLLSLYSRRIYKTILAVTKNREDAEDALQDTFFRAYRALHTFEERSAFYSWLTRIAINSALMIRRKRRACPEVLISASCEAGNEVPSFEIRDLAPNPEQICDQRQQRIRLLMAIRKLKPTLRAVLEIQMMQSYSVREIAHALDISEAAVKSRLYRARNQLMAPYLFGGDIAKRRASSEIAA
jgi:RNA polymerase sigma-70 factor, ECF subfamily